MPSLEGAEERIDHLMFSFHFRRRTPRTITSLYHGDLILSYRLPIVYRRPLGVAVRDEEGVSQTTKRHIRAAANVVERRGYAQIGGLPGWRLYARRR